MSRVADLPPNVYNITIADDLVLVCCFVDLDVPRANINILLVSIHGMSKLQTYITLREYVRKSCVPCCEILCARLVVTVSANIQSHNWPCPADTQSKNNVVKTSNDVATSFWCRNDVIIAACARVKIVPVLTLEDFLSLTTTLGSSNCGVTPLLGMPVSGAGCWVLSAGKVPVQIQIRHDYKEPYSEM